MVEESFEKHSVALHQEWKGKIEIRVKSRLRTQNDLSIAYTPGVAYPVELIRNDKQKAYELTMKQNTVAIVTDGSAVLGLGNVGATAALPVMEGKAAIMKEFANINAIPLCLETQNTEEIIHTIRIIAPVFGAINLEDIAAPKCFIIEETLQDLGIPVFHDDQHGTAIALLAGLINACKVTGKSLCELKVVINGAGAAGSAITELVSCIGHENKVCQPVKEVIICDRKGIIHRGRKDLSEHKHKLSLMTNQKQEHGSLKDAMVDADVIIGVSGPETVTTEMVQSMSKNAIVFAMANPIPEIMPETAKNAGASVVGTGRSDFPNQINNALVFPGIFKGLLASRAKRITAEMKVRAAFALADCITPTPEKILPSLFDKKPVNRIAEVIRKLAP